MAQLVGNTRHERNLGTDDDEIDVERVGEREQPFPIVGTNRVAGAERGDAGIAGGGVELAQALALGELPGERVLAAAGTDD